jgi:NADH-quinone oxidoreductase subunit H
VFIFFFVWLRGVLPRMRYDAFMRFGWKVLVPVGLAWIMLVAASRTVAAEVEDRRTLFTLAGIVMAVLLLVVFFLPERKTAQDAPGTDVTPKDEGGFPTPPMDLVVPPTPRSLARSSVSAGEPGPGRTDVHAGDVPTPNREA